MIPITFNNLLETDNLNLKIENHDNLQTFEESILNQSDVNPLHLGGYFFENYDEDSLNFNVSIFINTTA